MDDDEEDYKTVGKYYVLVQCANYIELLGSKFLPNPGFKTYNEAEAALDNYLKDYPKYFGMILDVVDIKTTNVTFNSHKIT